MMNDACSFDNEGNKNGDSSIISLYCCVYCNPSFPSDKMKKQGSVVVVLFPTLYVCLHYSLFEIYMDTTFVCVLFGTIKNIPSSDNNKDFNVSK